MSVSSSQRNQGDLETNSNEQNLEEPTIISIEKEYFLIKSQLTKLHITSVRKFLIFNNRDKSAIISLILREKEKEIFWNKINLDEIMESYVEHDDNNLKNLFSILMYDWHEPERKSNKNYFLVRKFESFENAYNKIFENQKQPSPSLQLEISSTTLNVENESKSSTNFDETIKLQDLSNQQPTSDISHDDQQNDQNLSELEPLMKSEGQEESPSEPQSDKQQASSSSSQQLPSTSSDVINEKTNSSSSDNHLESQNLPIIPQPSTLPIHQTDDESSSKKDKTIFEKLLKVINNKELAKFHDACLKIIYYFIEEKIKIIEEAEVEEKIIFSSEIFDLIPEVMKIQNNDEYKVKILKLFIIFVDNEQYADIKTELYKFLSQKPATYVGKTYYDYMIDHCDRQFFNLVSSLKEDLIPIFKVDYKNYIELYKSYFGEYWSYAIKENGQLLYHLTKFDELEECQMFILMATEESKLNASLTSQFTDAAEFQAVFNEPLDKNDEKKYQQFKDFVKNYLFRYIRKRNLYVAQSLDFKKIFINTKQIRRFLFGRESFEAKSIFEEIFYHEKMKNHVLFFDDLLNYIWNEFRLWEVPQILALKNPLGKRFIDYVFENCGDYQKIYFLNVKDLDIYKGIQKPLKCMMLKSSLFPKGPPEIDSNEILIEENSTEAASSNEATTNDEDTFENFKVRDFMGPFINFQIKLIDETKEDDENEYEAYNLANYLYLLEEMNQFCHSKTENFEVIKSVFNYIPSNPDSSYFLIPRKNFCRGLMMINWNYYVENDENTLVLQSLPLDEEKISKIELNGVSDPYLYLISLLVTKKYEKFLNEFPSKFKEIVTNYKNSFIYRKKKFESISTNTCFVLLYGAIKANQKEIVQQMFSYNSFVINFHEFPPNMIPGEIHAYTIKMYLEYKYQLTKDVDIPDSWITHDVVKEFLDSRIKSQDKFYKIDCQFLLPHEMHDKTPNKNSNNYGFKEDYYTLQFILDSYKLNSLVAHPVMETVIRTKIEKYDRIFFWNFILFLICYIVPTIAIASKLHSKEENLDINQSASKCVIWCSALRFTYLSAKEYYQAKRFYGWTEYFTKYSNWVEIVMIFLCSITFFTFLITELKFYHFLTCVEALNIALTIFSAINSYPIMKLSIYVKCFFMSFRTYVYVLLFLLPLSIGSILLIFILFNKANNGQIEDFHNINNATMKYFIMYNGELGISANEIIGSVQVIAIVIIIMFSITKSNMILAIVLDDIQKTLADAKKITLRSNAKKYVELAQKMEKCYKEYTDIKAEKLTIYTFFRKPLYAFEISLIKSLIKKYSHIHELHYFHINEANGYVHINDQRPLFEYGWWSHKCWRSGGKFVKWTKKQIDKILFLNLVLDADTMNEIKDIIDTETENNQETAKDQDNDKLRKQIENIKEENHKLKELNASLIKTIEAMTKSSNKVD